MTSKINTKKQLIPVLNNKQDILMKPYFVPLEFDKKLEHSNLFLLSDNKENIIFTRLLFNNIFNQLANQEDNQKLNEFDFKLIYDPLKQYSYEELNYIFQVIQRKDIFITHNGKTSSIMFREFNVREKGNHNIWLESEIKDFDNYSLEQSIMSMLIIDLNSKEEIFNYLKNIHNETLKVLNLNGFLLNDEVFNITNTDIENIKGILNKYNEPNQQTKDIFDIKVFLNYLHRKRNVISFYREHTC